MSSVYDARGRVTRQSDQHGYNTYYTLDGGDRLTAVTNAQGVTTRYTYDEVGNMTSVTDGNGNVTSYVRSWVQAVMNSITISDIRQIQ